MGSPASRKSGLIIAVVVVAAAIALGVVIYRGGAAGNRPDAASSGASSPGSVSGRNGKLSTDAVLSIAPGTGAKQAPKRVLSPTLQEYANAKSYGALYQRINASTTRTPEEQWMLAQMLERCAKSKERPREGPRWALGGDDAKARFAASLSPKDPDREKRLAAFEQINSDLCSGVGDVEVTDAEIDKLYELGAAGGDPKARAGQVRRDLMRQGQGPDGKYRFDPTKMPTITDTQVDTLKQSFASGDPYAMQAAVSTFGFPMQNLSLRVGADELPINANALYNAATLAACDYGYPCGPDSRQLLQACAMQGQCGATDYREYVFFYGSSPATSQLIGAYNVALANAARTGDWSYFTFHRGPPPNIAGYSTRP
ncbi:hypothetical protein DSM104443_01780 [Usitatibacter rugosus]|uniref:Uncharacterized protein n=1 Tax=Usitatibacter rugosus TaxID=2732067 RepID=A0A6M4GUK2_9PROT|nr:hypothetical protein [Usitatibacter rugosus]QJR10712.1 hypothetical protein DSM104443_01780 [Usitatibacter rugosus]